MVHCWRTGNGFMMLTSIQLFVIPQLNGHKTQTESVQLSESHVPRAKEWDGGRGREGGEGDLFRPFDNGKKGLSFFTSSLPSVVVAQRPSAHAHRDEKSLVAGKNHDHPGAVTQGTGADQRRGRIE